MEVSLWVALLGGFASFISPCCLPLFPTYLSYITGISVADLREGGQSTGVRAKMIVHSLLFLVGFSTVYYALGYGVNAFATLFATYDQFIQQISAVIIFFMGLVLLGVLQPQILMQTFRIPVAKRTQSTSSYVGSFIFGLGFSAGWSPCTGPILAGILGIAATEPGQWFALTTAYSIGFAIPFIGLAFFLGTTRFIVRYSDIMMKIGGVMMIAFAALLYFDQTTVLNIWLNQVTPEWLKF